MELDVLQKGTEDELFKLMNVNLFFIFSKFESPAFFSSPKF